MFARRFLLLSARGAQAGDLQWGLPSGVRADMEFMLQHVPSGKYLGLGNKTKGGFESAMVDKPGSEAMVLSDKSFAGFGCVRGSFRFRRGSD